MKMRMCELDPRWLQIYLDEELSPAEERVIEEHLSRCEECRGELQWLKSIFHNLASLETLQPSSDFTERFIELYREKWKPSEVERGDSIDLLLGIVKSALSIPRQARIYTGQVTSVFTSVFRYMPLVDLFKLPTLGSTYDRVINILSWGRRINDRLDSLRQLNLRIRRSFIFISLI